jgi:hypothetical protein
MLKLGRNMRAIGIRPSTVAAGVLAAGLVLFALMLLHARFAAVAGVDGAARALAGRLGLTDLALFTEARYTRHPSQADLATPFQDHPLALDHFPSASLVVPTRPASGIALSAAAAAVEHSGENGTKRSAAATWQPTQNVSPRRTPGPITPASANGALRSGHRPSPSLVSADMGPGLRRDDSLLLLQLDPWLMNESRVGAQGGPGR